MYLVLDTETCGLGDDSPLLMMQWGLFDERASQLNEVALWKRGDPSTPRDIWEEIHVTCGPFKAYVFCNAKFDFKVLRRNGILVPLKKVIDVSLIDYCIDTRRKSRTMAEIASSLGSDEEKQEWDHNKNETFLTEEGRSQESWGVFQEYALQDIRTTASILSSQLPLLHGDEGLRKMVRLEHDYLEVLVEMEDTGLYLDASRVSEVSLEIENLECSAMDEMRSIVRFTPGEEKLYSRQYDIQTGERHPQGHPRSAETVGGIKVAGRDELMFDHCQLLPFVATPSQFLWVWTHLLGEEPPTFMQGREEKVTTQAEILEPLAGDWDVPSSFCRSFLDWKKMSKLRTSFLGKWEGLERVTYHFNQRGTSTGRLSCSVGSTLVFTESGEIPISSIQVGDKVWTHKGRFQEVLATFDNGIQEVFDVEFEDGEVLSVTGEHRLLMEEGTWRSINECRQEMESLL